MKTSNGTIRARYTAIVILCMLFPGVTSLLATQQAFGNDDVTGVVDIGSRRELFVDRHIVGELNGTSLKLHTPQLMPPISPPRPHGHYATVLRADDKFQFYYRGDTTPGNHWKKGWEQYHEGEVTLYAESKNGINWTLPKLGIYDDHPTFPAGNVVLMNDFLVTHNFTPFIDTKPGVSDAERYKALGGLAYQPHKEHLEVRSRRGPGGLKAYTSPDGIHWKRLRGEPVVPEEWGKYFDSQNYAFWSDSEQAYVCDFEEFHQLDTVRRDAGESSKRAPLHAVHAAVLSRAAHLHRSADTVHGQTRIGDGHPDDEHSRRRSVRS
jgi:hypothetical protein